MSLKNKLKEHPILLKEYKSIIEDQEKRGIIERVADEEENPLGQTHYLPHHPVVRQDKSTTKVRIVYDASASTGKGVSLNQSVYPGPCLLKTVAEVLTRFRLFPIALTSDIEKAFLMISINKADRDALRFLWYDDVQKDEPKILTYRFCRVVFGVTCSPFLLNATLRHHIEQYSEQYPELCAQLICSLYADDVNQGAYSVESAISQYEISKKLMKEGGFNLRKWNSNSQDVMEYIKVKEQIQPSESRTSEDDQTYAQLTTANLDSNDSENKVLGISWSIDSDNLLYKLSHLRDFTEVSKVTKRNILKTIASIFDPLGLISPVVTPLKVFMQKLFEKKLGWDDQIGETFEKEWKKFMTELERLNEISVPRYYFGALQAKPDQIQLFGFCDSSSTAYAALVYAKITIDGKSSVNLVMSKSRVAPLKKLSIPRLELMSCLVLSRLITSVKGMIETVARVEIIRCWTDSISALYWVRGVNKEWKIFVENRVQEIRKLVPDDLWAHCPGKENPADIPTRKLLPSVFEQQSEWWTGPPWLMQNESSWPQKKVLDEIPKDCVSEMRKNNAETTTLHTVAKPVVNLNDVISIETFSSYNKLVRTVALVQRFIGKCKKTSTAKGELSSSEIQKAEELIILSVQSQLDQKNLTNPEKQLGLYKDEQGLVRCKGRLNNSDLNVETRNPILLPRDHPLTTLVIRQCHANVLHNGVKETLLELRSRFWVVKGRQLTKKILHSCVTCRRIEGISYGKPETGQMPEFRVKGSHAFSSVGVDFAGPLYVKNQSNSLDKVYLTIFTCATTRAIHLELVSDLSTDSFLLCLKRFVNRRGTPNIIVSDNAKTFKSASKTLTRLFKSNSVNNYLINRKITWKFNLAKAPWWGGFYERLIRSVKSCLKKNLGTVKLTHDELNTIVTEIEAVLNSRPLSYLYSDSLEEPLTPSHMLLGRRILGLPEYKDEEDKVYNESADSSRRRCKYLSRVLEHYWRRWKSEYLVDLREYHKSNKKRNGMPEIAIGDVVTIEDENKKNRTCWRLGKVELVLRGQDNVARGARVRLANGNRIERPLQKLFPLELAETTSEIELTNPLDSSNEIETRRLTRKAATVAAERIKIIDQLENE